MGSTGEKNKPHWMGWKKICLSKDQGGMEFRELRSFNQAMLVKINGRLIREPNALLTRTLKTEFFSISFILKAITHLKERNFKLSCDLNLFNLI